MENKIKQYSFKSNNPKVYLIATPIGNLQEMTPRAINVIKNNVQKIYCEDTRNTLKLLNFFNLKKKLISLNKKNEIKRFSEIVNDLMNNLSIAIISDAGYPLISDPGYYIINKILTEYHYDIISISGSNAALNAIVGSGFNPRHFLFFGFLSRTEIKKINELEKISELQYPVIFYESPHRILKTLKLILKVLGNRKIVVCKELTKINEQWYRGFCQEVITFLSSEVDFIFGEYVIIVDKFNFDKKNIVSDKILINEIEQLIKNKNYFVKQAINFVSKKYKISKNILYYKYNHKKIF